MQHGQAKRLPGYSQGISRKTEWWITPYHPHGTGYHVVYSQSKASNKPQALDSN